jgi:hypothetical protein
MARYTKESFPRPTFVTAVQLCHTAVPGGIVGLSGNLPTRTSHTLAASCPRKRYTSRAPDHGHGRRTPDSAQIATDGFEQRNYRALAQLPQQFEKNRLVGDFLGVLFDVSRLVMVSRRTDGGFFSLRGV